MYNLPLLPVSAFIAVCTGSNQLVVNSHGFSQTSNAQRTRSLTVGQ